MRRKVIHRKQPNDKALLYCRKFFRHVRRMAVKDGFREAFLKAGAEENIGVLIQDYQFTFIVLPKEEEECGSSSSHSLPL